MANQFFIPFNNDPISTTTHSGSYNLPAGKYARIRPIEFEADLTIDGQIVHPQETFRATVVFNSAGYAKFPIPSSIESRGGGRITMSIRHSTGQQVEWQYRDFAGGIITTVPLFSPGTSFVNQLEDVFFNAGSTLYVRNPQSTASTYAAVSITSPNTPSSFWATGNDGGGTTITGDKFVVELYDSVA